MKRTVTDGICDATGKVCRTKPEADHVVLNMKRRGSNRIRSYKCNNCGTYHVGNSGVKKGRRMRTRAD
jgi:hypothetical protein